MSLPSQNGRPILRGPSRAREYRRRRKSARPLLLGAFVLVAVGGTSAWLLAGRGEPGETRVAAAETEPQRAESNGSENRSEETSQRRTSSDTREAPTTVINQGTRPEASQPSTEAARRTLASDGGRGVLSRALDTRAEDAAEAPRREAPAREEASTTRTPRQPTLGGSGSSPRGASSRVASLEEAAERRIRNNEPLDARELLNRALRVGDASEADRRRVREALGRLNEDLVFSPRVYPGDPITDTYTVQSGDALSRITRRMDLAVDHRLLTRINRLANENSIRVGQRLKVVRGPFHAVVTKSDYRLDLYWGPPDEPEDWIFIRSFIVGLGEDDSTPLGEFVVRRNSRLINPGWTNPRTGETFAPDDPENPIGNHWVGLRGVSDSAPLSGYGLHGTIEPESIGQQMSMGCVRMHNEDIELMFELMAEEVSVVRIVP